MKKTYLIGVTLLIVGIMGITLLSPYGETLRVDIGAKDDYIACGCGGCGGASEQAQEQVFRSKEAFKQAVEADKKLQGSSQCNLVGCQICRHYILKV